MVPYSKTGGLADVAGALPKALAARGVKVVAFSPYYAVVKNGGYKVKPTGIGLKIPVGENVFDGEVLKGSSGRGKPDVYFIARDAYFDRPEIYGTSWGDYPDNVERFTFFSRAVIEATRTLGIRPDVMHVNDWQTAMIPVYLKTIYKNEKAFRKTKCLMAIHNIAYQGVFPEVKYPVLGLDWKYYNWLELEFYDKVCLLKGGIVFSEAISTVSKRYSEEITTPEFGWGLNGVLSERRNRLYGIVNGVDYSVWDPGADTHIPENYSIAKLAGKARCKEELQKEMGLPVAPEVPLIGFIGRLADQKGMDILAGAMEGLMNMNIQFVVLGTGAEHYHQMMDEVAAARPDKMAVRITFDNALAHRIEAGCDMFLMPSRYEPCGLSQLYSLRYGTVPIVHLTGGLADTVVNCNSASLKRNKATGFEFVDYTPWALLDAVERAVEAYHNPMVWKKLQKTGMKQDWSWDRSAAEYVKLYKRMMER